MRGLPQQSPGAIQGVGSLRAVLFDAGETLVFMRPSMLGAYVKVCREAGLDVDAERLRPGLARAAAEMERRLRARSDLRTDPEREFAQWVAFNRMVFDCIGLPAADAADLSHRMEEAYEGGRLTSPEPDTLPTLERLRAAGLKIGVVSNSSPGMRGLLELSGIAARVDAIAISAVEGWQKPSPRLFEICLERLGVAPAHAIHVGDSVTADLGGATAAGLAGFVLLANGQTPPPGHAGPVIHRLSDLFALIDLAPPPQGQRECPHGHRPAAAGDSGALSVPKEEPCRRGRART